MALQIEVTKVSVSEQMNKLWNITLNLKCTEDTVEVINQNFSVRYRPGQDIQARILKIQEEMQDTIDNYNSEQQIFNQSALDTAVTNIQNNLEG